MNGQVKISIFKNTFSNLMIIVCINLRKPLKKLSSSVSFFHIIENLDLLSLFIIIF